MAIAWGNFGACPQPPWVRSSLPASACEARRQIVVGYGRGGKIETVGGLNRFSETAGTGLQLIAAVHPGVLYGCEDLSE